MFLSQIRNSFKKVSSKITLSYLIFFLLSYIVIYFSTTYIFSETLRKIDHKLIDSKLSEFSTVYNKEGLKSLIILLESENSKYDDQQFLVRIVDSNNQAIYSRIPPAWEGIDPARLENDFKNIFLDPSHPKRVMLYTQEDAVELTTASLIDQNKMIVGKNIDDREDMVEKIKFIFFAVLFPTLFLSVSLGLFFTRQILSPIRNIIETVKSITTGAEGRRVPEVDTNDELQELIQLFNQMLARIQTSQQRIRETLDDVAHDLRTPLTQIRGYAELTLGKARTAEEYNRSLEVCIESSDRMMKLINSIMDISQAESGQKSLQISEFEINEIIDEVLDLYSIVAEEKNMSLEFERQEPTRLRADKIKLRQVLANLIDNAIKYSHHDGQIKISTHKNSQFLTIEVQDQGIGISEQDIPFIWDRLYRADKSRSEKGLGLGLSLVKTLVEAHHGQVEVVSHLGSGSIFKIRLPLKPD